MRDSKSQLPTIEATDLSPIKGITSDEEDWLRQLAMAADAETLALKLGDRSNDDPEPVATFDARSGCWWTGRYIGELHFEGRTLRILPRFGMPMLERWLSRIWGVRFVASMGKYEKARVWLWALLAKLWETRLLAAARHGLPTTRFDEFHIGPTIRGRLHVPRTAREVVAGRQNIVSSTRNRHIDNRIGGIVVHAFEHLCRELRQFGDERTWLTHRAQNLIQQLRSHISRREAVDAAESRVPVRYSPITETYREVVQLSHAISRQQPSSSSASGSKNVLGVLIDMAEVWELYLFHLLRSALRKFEVIHTGRDVDGNNFLFRSTQSGEGLGKLKPDILVRSVRSNRLLAIVDAKYKTTRPSPERPDGILREDRYQIAAYLSAYGNASEMLQGALVYPATEKTPNIVALQSKSPWRITASERQVWFFGLACQATTHPGLEMTESESEFIKRVELAIEDRRAFDAAGVSGAPRLRSDLTG